MNSLKFETVDRSAQLLTKLPMQPHCQYVRYTVPPLSLFRPASKYVKDKLDQKHDCFKLNKKQQDCSSKKRKQLS
jgi:hypothetical protein